MFLYTYLEIYMQNTCSNMLQFNIAHPFKRVYFLFKYLCTMKRRDKACDDSMIRAICV